MRYRRTMRTLRTITTALIMAAALAACSSGANDSADQDYYDTIRSLPGFEEATAAELDDLAVGGCDLVQMAVDNGLSNEEAVDAVYRSFRAAGLTEAEALQGTIAVVGTYCPIDISK